MTALRVFGENQRPIFPSAGEIELSVAEDARRGANIGAPVAAQDPENDRLTYTLSGTDAAAFTIVETTGQIRVKEALDFETKPSYRVTVDVHDGKDGAGQPSEEIDDSQTVLITIENVDEPGTVTLSSLTQTFQARVEVTAELSDDDRPSGVSWQWSRSPNGRTDWVNIPGATGSAYTPTLEADAGNYIRATASYDDGHGPNKSAEAVSSRVGDPPPVNSKPAFPTTDNGQRSVAEDAQAGAPFGDPVAATDVNAGDSAVNDPLAYSLTGADAASFTINAATGQLRLESGVTLDYEGKQTYRVNVRVTDGRDLNGDDDNDAIDDTINVTIHVTDVNEAPTVTGDSTASIAENSSSMVAKYSATDPERDTLTWSVDDTNTTNFWISNQGQLYFRSPPSFEAGENYTVIITATDDDADNALSGSLSVTITVTDAEEDGSIIIEPPRGWDGTVFTAVLDDRDGDVDGEMWQWQRSSNRSSWDDIPTATSETYTATADDIGQYLRATVTYTDRRSAGKEASAALTGRIEDSSDRPITNNAPSFTETAPERSIGQGTGAGRSVGAPVKANDDDTGDVLTYSLSGTDSDLFNIDPITGQIQTKAVLEYDPDGENSYSVQVNVYDGFGPTHQSFDVGVDVTIDVTITVTKSRGRTTSGGVSGGGGGGGPPPVPIPSDGGFRLERDPRHRGARRRQRPADRDLVRRDHALGRGERGDRSRPGLCLQPAHG